MNTPSQDLYQLIHSMSKNEKRYFKKFSELHRKEDNKYLLLFDAIAAQKEFDEESIKKKFRGEAFLRQFPVAKNYLYSKILDAMEIYHRDSSIHAQVRRNIYRAELLQKKGLYEASMKLLRKAKNDAENSDLLPALLEIQTQWEFSALLERYDLPGLEKLIAETERTTTLLNDTLNCSGLSLQMAGIYHRYYQTRDPKFLKQAEHIMKHPLFQKESAISTFTGKLRIHEAKLFYWYAKGKPDAACEAGEKAVRLCLDHPEHLRNNIKHYMVLLSNLYYIRAGQKKFTAAGTLLDKLADTSRFARTYSLSSKFFYLFQNTSLHYLCQTGNLDELRQRVPVVLAGFKTHEAELSNYEKTALLMNLSIAHFYLGDVRSCIQQMNRLRNEYDLGVNPEAQYFLNFFYLIAHYESGHHELLPHLVQSFRRFLQKKSFVSKTESGLAGLLKRKPSGLAANRRDPALLLMKKEIENIPNDEAHYHVFKYFDIVSWLESRITGRPFSELIRKK